MLLVCAGSPPALGMIRCHLTSAGNSQVLKLLLQLLVNMATSSPFCSQHIWAQCFPERLVAFAEASQGTSGLASAYPIHHHCIFPTFSPIAALILDNANPPCACLTPVLTFCCQNCAVLFYQHLLAHQPRVPFLQRGLQVRYACCFYS